MWSVQVQGIEDAGSSHSHQKEVSGYSVEQPPSTKEVDDAQATVPLVPEEVEAQADPVYAHTEVTQAEETEDVVAEAMQGASEDATVDSPVAFPSSEPTENPDEVVETQDQIDTEPTSVAFPSSEDQEALELPAAEDGSAPSDDTPAPVAFPSSDSPAPIAFPGSGDDTESQRAMSIPERAQTPQTTGVTFQDAQTPQRSGTPSSPDPDGKRRRTLSTQGIQRLARRISVSRRQDSTSSIPKIAGAFMSGLKREGTSGSKDDNSTKDAGARESPTASVSSDIGKTKSKKKEKKDKRKSGV